MIKIKCKVSDNATPPLKRVKKGLSGKIQKQVSRVAAHWLKREITQSIAYQTIRWKNRSPLTRSLDPRILVDTKEYLQSFEVLQASDGVYQVACNAQKRQWSEFGTVNQPARKHWAPAVKKMRQTTIPKMVGRLVWDELTGRGFSSI